MTVVLSARECHRLLAAIEAAGPPGETALQRQRHRDELLEVLTEAVAALLRQEARQAG